MPCRAVIRSIRIQTNIDMHILTDENRAHILPTLFVGPEKTKTNCVMPFQSTLFHNAHYLASSFLPSFLPSFLSFSFFGGFYLSLSPPPLIKVRNPSWFWGRSPIPTYSFSCVIHSNSYFLLEFCVAIC